MSLWPPGNAGHTFRTGPNLVTGGVERSRSWEDFRAERLS